MDDKVDATLVVLAHDGSASSDCHPKEVMMNHIRIMHFDELWFGITDLLMPV